MAEIGIPLCDLVNAVRAEMEQAALQARDKQLQFEVQDLQLEVEIATTRTREGEGGLKIVVVTAGAKASKADVTSHKVTLKLLPVTASGTRFKVSDIVDRPVPST
jgi:glycine/D-amino acid oxidase-like deaminating enzyme